MYETLTEGEHKVLSKEIFEKIKSLCYGKVFCDTTANWNSKPTMVSIKNAVYVYVDYYTKNNKSIPAFKIGDGMAYVVDLPFTDAIVADHMANGELHIQAGERSFWNGKMRCYVGDNEDLVFTTH